jgi:leucyl/phenylalanyl-tRNA--protein transferase
VTGGLPERRSGRFPEPSSAGEDGLLCVGGDLEPETLLEAYSMGVFPWPQEGLPLLWFSPAQRGVLRFEDAHWTRRFLRALRQQPGRGYEIAFDRAFGDVVRACARAKRKGDGEVASASKDQPANQGEGAGQGGTWILPEIEVAYERLHRLGYAHSAECWRGGALVGGVYGVLVDGVFSGESMFHAEADAGKRALYALIELLAGAGIKWIDIQMVTPVLEALGGRYVARSAYAALLARSRRAGIEPFPAKPKEVPR